MTEQMMKHVGRLKNTDHRCVIVFMQVPGKEDHALVINTEALPPRFEQALMDIVQSAEAQAVQDLGNVMARRLMPDSNMDVLNVFHQSGFLRAEPVDNVIMYPRPNMPFPLRKILEAMGKTITRSIEDPVMEAMQKYNPYDNNTKALNAEQKLGIAKNILMQAQDLENEASRKREEAYQMAPELRPASNRMAQQEAMLQDAQMIHKVQTSPNGGEQSGAPSADRKVWSRDIGDMSPEQARETLARLQEQFQTQAHEMISDLPEAPKRRGPGRPRKHPQ